jgi:hypothetical protein
MVIKKLVLLLIVIIIINLIKKATPRPIQILQMIGFRPRIRRKILDAAHAQPDPFVKKTVAVKK